MRTSLQTVSLARITALCALFLLAGLLTLVLRPHASAVAHAQGSSNSLSGYAWSDMPDQNDENKAAGRVGRGAGWIRFNCDETAVGGDTVCASSNYGVSANSSGNLGGKAWSENIGWISFDWSDVSGCPGSSCQPWLNPATGALSGFARALGATQAQAGGWDGWISLNCRNENVCGTSNYGITVSGCNWSGYAWGGDILGWIYFGPLSSHGGVTGSGTGCDIPTASLSGNPTARTGVGNTTLTWSSTGASSCTGSNFSTGAATTGNATVVISQTTLYGITCSGQEGSASASVVVSVTYPSPTVSLSASASLVRAGNGVNLNWNVANINPDSCAIAADSSGFTASLGGALGGASSGSGTLTSPGIQQRTTFTLSCTGQDGSPVAAATIVGLIPAVQEI